MCVIYQVALQGWTKEEAIREMKDGGYDHHKIFKNLERYIRKLDVAAIKKRAAWSTNFLKKYTLCFANNTLKRSSDLRGMNDSKGTIFDKLIWVLGIISLAIVVGCLMLLLKA